MNVYEEAIRVVLYELPFSDDEGELTDWILRGVLDHPDPEIVPQIRQLFAEVKDHMALRAQRRRSDPPIPDFDFDAKLEAIIGPE